MAGGRAWEPCQGPEVKVSWRPCISSAFSILSRFAHPAGNAKDSSHNSNRTAGQASPGAASPHLPQPPWALTACAPQGHTGTEAWRDQVPGVPTTRGARRGWNGAGGAGGGGRWKLKDQRAGSLEPLQEGAGPRPGS